MSKEKKTEISKEGYLVFKDSKMPLHRWKAERKYGKEAVKGKEVHHIDGDKLNNDFDNLILLSTEDHYTLHKQQDRMEEYAEMMYEIEGKYTIDPWAILLLFIASLITGFPIADAIVSVTLAAFAILFGIKKEGIGLWAYILGKRHEDEEAMEGNRS